MSGGTLGFLGALPKPAPQRIGGRPMGPFTPLWKFLGSVRCWLVRSCYNPIYIYIYCRVLYIYTVELYKI